MEKMTVKIGVILAKSLAMVALTASLCACQDDGKKQPVAAPASSAPAAQPSQSPAKTSGKAPGGSKQSADDNLMEQIASTAAAFHRTKPCPSAPPGMEGEAAGTFALAGLFPAANAEFDYGKFLFAWPHKFGECYALAVATSARSFWLAFANPTATTQAEHDAGIVGDGDQLCVNASCTLSRHGITERGELKWALFAQHGDVWSWSGWIAFHVK